MKSIIILDENTNFKNLPCDWKFSCLLGHIITSTTLYFNNTSSARDATANLWAPQNL